MCGPASAPAPRKPVERFLFFECRPNEHRYCHARTPRIALRQSSHSSSLGNDFQKTGPSRRHLPVLHRRTIRHAGCASRTTQLRFNQPIPPLSPRRSVDRSAHRHRSLSRPQSKQGGARFAGSRHVHRGTSTAGSCRTTACVAKEGESCAPIGVTAQTASLAARSQKLRCVRCWSPSTGKGSVPHSYGFPPSTEVVSNSNHSARRRINRNRSGACSPRDDVQRAVQVARRSLAF